MSDKEKGGDEGGSHHHKKKSKKGSKKGDKQKDGEKEVPATKTEKGDMHLGDLFNGYTIEKLGATDGSYMEKRFRKLPKNVFLADAFVTDKHLPDFPDVRELKYWAKEEAEVADKSEAYALGSSVAVDVSGNAGVNVTGVEVQGATLGGNLKLVGDYKSNHAARSWSVVHTKYHPKFKLVFQLDNLMKEKEAKDFLDSEFIADVLALETDIENEENFKGWVGFLKKWGTHIPLEAEFGGYLRASTTVKLRSKHREIGGEITGWLSAQVQQTLGVKIEGGVKPKVTRDSWEVQQEIDLHQVGGDDTIQFKPIMIDVTDISKALNLATEDIKTNAEALKAWVESLTGNLVVINMHFAAIETLFEWVLKGTDKQGQHEELMKTREYFYPRVVVLYHGKDNHHALKFDHDHKGRFVTATVENDARPGYEFLFYEFKMRKESCVTYCHLESGRFICADSHNVVRVADSRVDVGATFEKIQSEEGPDYVYLQTGTGKYLGFKAFILGILESHKLTCIDGDHKEKHGQWRLRYLV